jgi:hypothetical protein
LRRYGCRSHHAFGDLSQAEQVNPNNTHMNKLSRSYYSELAVFCMDYHSGQWSRGYRILSRLNIRNFSSELCAELRESEAYEWLVQNYAAKI